MKASNSEIDWERELSRVSNERRLEAFVYVMKLMSDEQYWECLSFVWQTSELVTPDLEIWKSLFSSSRTGRENLMTCEEHARLAAMPDNIKVYRGFNQSDWHRGMSWTLSKDVAYFFGRYCTSTRRAIMFGANGPAKPMLSEAMVRKENVFAFINARKEEELVLDPDCPLEDLVFRPVPKKWKFRKP